MTQRRTLRSLSIAGLLTGLITSLVLVAPSASAAELVLTDPAHDTARSGLDIVSATVDNADYVVTVDVNFAKHRSGNTIVGLGARDRKTLRIVNSHDPEGRDRTVLLDRTGRIGCDGLTGTWKSDTAELTLTVPSTCLWRGNYGSLHTWVLTEPLRSGEDVDFLQKADWVARG